MDSKLTYVKDYTEEKSKALQSFEQNTSAISKELNDARQEVLSEFAGMQKKLEEAHRVVKGKIDDYMKNYKQFPNECNNSVVMCHDFVTSKIEGTIDVKENFPMQNITFDNKNRELAIKALKLFLSNILLSVQVKKLTVDIIDPQDMCSDFTEFFSQETSDYIQPNAKEPSALIKDLYKLAQDNIITLDGKSIDEFNKIAEEQEMVPVPYKLVIFVSGFEQLLTQESNVVFQKMLSYSAKNGVILWFLNSEAVKDSLWISTPIMARPNFIQYTRDLGTKTMDVYKKTLVKFRPKAIDYTTKFADKFIPRDKWWTFDTIKGIDMHFGLQNGDPTLGYPLVIGDANVHAIMGGATGAGKSAAINQMLISLITKYPPSELQIVFIDFKNVEAAKFTQGYKMDTNEWMTDEEHKKLLQDEKFFTRLSTIPHLRILSGTTDGEYALSVFEFLMDEMARRQAIINKAGQTKVQDLREQILDDYCKMKGKKVSWYEMRQDWDWYKPNVYDVYGDMPRLLVIFDEFQVMYNPEFVDAKIIDLINGKITAIAKLARAMGAHFWFTSQSMKGTMSKDTMANFSMRAALRCTTEVSSELLGNGAAGTITEKFGFIYTNCTAGQDKNDNKLWKVPFLATPPMMQYIDDVCKLVEPRREKHLMTEFYDEKVLVPSDEMVKWYKNYPDKFKEPGALILGERANFSTNKAPYSTTLMEDGGENIMVAAFDRSDMMNLGLTIINNIRMKDDVKLIINCQDKDTYELMEIDNLVEDAFIDLSRPSQPVDELIDALDSMVNSRRSKSGPFKSVYVVLIQWERAPMISVDPNYKLQDKFKAILRDAPSVGIYFVFVSREKLEMPRMIPNSCNHKIAGLLTKDSMFFINSIKVEKLPSAAKGEGLFALYEYGSTLAKFRIYQHVFTREIKQREVVI